MSSEITTVFTLIGSVIAAGAAYMFTKWREREAEWQKEKRELYKEFVVSLSCYIADKSSPDKQARFINACNSLNIIAPQAVIEALKAYYENEENTSCIKKLISKVLFEMRRDLKISPGDDPETFSVQWWVPPKSESPPAKPEVF